MLIVSHLNRTNFLSPQAVTLTPEYQALNGSQKVFTLHYITFGYESGVYDALKAAALAYGSKHKTPIKIRAYQLLAHRRIRRVLDLHFHRSELEVLLADLQRVVKKSEKVGAFTPQVAKALVAFTKYVAAKEKA